MSVPSVLLRLLLAGLLVLEGTGSALAALRMPLPLHQPAHAAAPMAEAGAPCHHAHDGSGAAHHAPSPQRGAPDRCKSSACTCACLSATIAVAAVPLLLRADFGSGLAPAPATTGHRPPLLSLLIRPPIRQAS
jgi:hypothetical protein